MVSCQYLRGYGLLVISQYPRPNLPSTPCGPKNGMNLLVVLKWLFDWGIYLQPAETQYHHIPLLILAKYIRAARQDTNMIAFQSCHGANFFTSTGCCLLLFLAIKSRNRRKWQKSSTHKFYRIDFCWFSSRFLQIFTSFSCLLENDKYLAALLSVGVAVVGRHSKLYMNQRATLLH